MGLFEEAGRRFERFKRQATAAADGETDYRCRDCEATFHAEYDECPDCGADAVVAVEAVDDGPVAADETPSSTTDEEPAETDH